MLRPRTSMPLAALLGLVLCTLLTGCSNLTQFAYNHADWLMYRKIQRFVDLDSVQESATKAALDRFHTWHRETQLPAYTAWLADFSQQVQSGPISADDVHTRIDQLQAFVDLCIAELLPSSVSIIQTLNDEQVAEIDANIDEERQEYIEEYVEISAAKLRKKRLKSFRKTVEPWLGDLTREQQGWLAAWAESLEPFAARSAEQQLIWQQKIATILAARDDRAALWQGLNSIVFTHTDDWQPELEAILDRNQDRTYALLARLINGTTPKQKAHFLERIEKFRNDFAALSASD